jgi:uncharacterized membrane protein YkoI
MNGMHISIVVAVSTSFFAMIVIFSNLHGNSLNENTQSTIAQIPAILRENDNGDEQNNLNVTDHTNIDPLDAILIASKKVSAQPSDLRSITLESKDGYPVYSMDIFESNSIHSVEVIVDAVSGKALEINQDLDDNANKIKIEDADESKE